MMMMISGSTPKIAMVTSAGAVSSQRLIRAFSSLRAAACWAALSWAVGFGSGEAGTGAGADNSVADISVLQHLHRLGGDAQADRIALFQDFLEAAAVLHADR